MTVTESLPNYMIKFFEGHKSSFEATFASLVYLFSHVASELCNLASINESVREFAKCHTVS